MADGTVVIQVKSNATSAAKDFDKLDKSLNSTGSASKVLDNQLSGLEKELRDLIITGKKSSSQFQMVSRQFVLAGKNAAKADSQISALKSEMRGADKETSALSSTMGVLGTAIAAVGLFELGKSAVQAGFKLTALENKFKAAAGSAEKGAESFQFIKDTTDELGLSFLETADAYAGFIAAATRSGLTFKESEQIFKDVATAASSLKLPAERVGLVFRALEQISSKGVVSMEELKLQLGDSLPGAVQIAAKAMDMTTQAFIKAVSAGEVMSQDFLPKFAKQIKDELGGASEEAAKSLQASFTRAGNAFVELGSELTEGGSVINTVLGTMTDLVTKATKGWTMFFDLFDGDTPLKKAADDFRETTTRVNELKIELAEFGETYKKSFSAKFIPLEETGKFKQLQEQLATATEKRADAQAKYNRERALSKSLETPSSGTGGGGDDPVVKETNLLKDLQDQANATKIELQNLFLSGQEDSDQFTKTKAEYDAITAKINAASDATKTFAKESKSSFDFAGSAADNFAINATRSLLSPWKEGETAADKFKQIAIDTIKDVLAEFIAAELRKQAVALVTAIFTGGGSLLGGAAAGATASAKGNAFSNGAVTDKFANGGMFTNSIVSSPTTFPMAGGKTGLMGEAGAEAIMPLDRDKNGRLGVQVQQAPANITVINNAPVDIQTVTRPDNQQEMYINLVNGALSDSRTSQGVSEALNRNSSRGAWGI